MHRGPSKDLLNEVERNLHDAMGVARNIAMDKRLVTGGGAVEMAVSRCDRRIFRLFLTGFLNPIVGILHSHNLPLSFF